MEATTSDRLSVSSGHTGRGENTKIWVKVSWTQLTHCMFKDGLRPLIPNIDLDWIVRFSGHSLPTTRPKMVSDLYY